MYDHAKVANENNRQLQGQIGVFQNRKVQKENRRIKSFPKFNPKEAEIHRKKLQKTARKRQIITILIYTITIIVVLYLVSQWQ